MVYHGSPPGIFSYISPVISTEILQGFTPAYLSEFLPRFSQVIFRDSSRDFPGSIQRFFLGFLQNYSKNSAQDSVNYFACILQVFLVAFFHWFLRDEFSQHSTRDSNSDFFRNPFKDFLRDCSRNSFRDSTRDAPRICNGKTSKILPKSSAGMFRGWIQSRYNKERDGSGIQPRTFCI